MQAKKPSDTQVAYDLQIQANKKRHEDDLQAALSLYDQAILAYEKDQNQAGMAEAYIGKFLTYKNFIFHTNAVDDTKRAYAALYESEKLVNSYGIEYLLPTVLFHFGKWFCITGNFKDATLYYQRALDSISSTSPDQANYLYHLGYAQYKLGEEEVGKNTMLKALADIHSHASQLDPLRLPVWESGCLMNLAECLWKKDNKSALEYLHAAEKIIAENDDMVMRQQHLAKLKRTLGIAS